MDIFASAGIGGEYVSFAIVKTNGVDYAITVWSDSVDIAVTDSDDNCTEAMIPSEIVFQIANAITRNETAIHAWCEDTALRGQDYDVTITHKTINIKYAIHHGFDDYEAEVDITIPASIILDLVPVFLKLS